MGRGMDRKEDQHIHASSDVIGSSSSPWQPLLKVVVVLVTLEEKEVSRYGSLDDTMLHFPSNLVTKRLQCPFIQKCPQKSCGPPSSVHFPVPMVPTEPRGSEMTIESWGTENSGWHMSPE